MWVSLQQCQGTEGTTSPACHAQGFPLLAHGPGPHISLPRTSVPSPLMPQQGQTPGPHSPAQLWAPLSWASLWTQVPVWPHPQGGARCLGLPLVPPSLPWLPGAALLSAWGSASSHCVLQSDRDLLAQRVCSDCPMSPAPTHAGLAQTKAGALNHVLCAYALYHFGEWQHTTHIV